MQHGHHGGAEHLVEFQDLHLVGRLSRLAGINLLPTFMVGAALLVLADFTAGRLLSPFQIPVGLISSALGGLYLMWLLGMGGRRRV